MTVQRILKELCDLANYIDENEIDSICNRFITAKEHNKLFSLPEPAEVAVLFVLLPTA